MKGKKKVILAVVIVLVIAIGGGTIFYVRNRDKTVVKVYSMEMLNSSDWFADDSELTGTLSSDYIQEVTVDSDKKVKKIYVKEGDQVKKGDLLLKYNMEEEELELKLQKLQIKSAQIEIEEMEKELKKLKNTTAVSSSADAGSSGVLEASANLSGIKGTALSYLVAEASSGSGSTESSETGGSGSTESSETGGSGSTESSETGGSGSTESSETGGNGSTESSETGGSGSTESSETGGSGSTESSETGGDGSTESSETGGSTTGTEEDGSTTEKKNNTSESSEVTLHTSITSLSQSESGDGTSSSPYIFYMVGIDATINGAVLKALSGKYATFYEYASEEAYKNGDNLLSFKMEGKYYIKAGVSKSASYTLTEAIGYMTTKKEESTSTESTTKTKKSIHFKQTRTTVKAGKIYRFSVVDEDGNSINQKKVQWTLDDNISKDTFLLGKTNGVKVYGTEDGVEIYIDEGEPSATLTLTAQAKSISGISTQKITKTLTVKGADTGDDDDENGGGSSDGGSSNSSGIDSGDEEEESYTKEELEEAISEKEEEIAEAKEELHEAKISYKEAKEEVNKGTVKATISGTVTSASDKGTLPTDGSAAIVIKAAEGMYVKTSVSELDLDTIKVGGTITCTSMETGDSYEAVVKEVSDFPSESDSDSSLSNPNSSYYPVVAFISDADGLSTGDTVEITYSSESMGTSDEDTIYIQKAYVRTEDGKSYVYKRNKKTKRLEKQYVKTGETMYGQYIEIKSGLSTEDYIAFPYGKTLKEGVKTKISEDDSDLIY